MIGHVEKLCFVAFLLIGTGSSQAQDKTIVMSAELAATAEGFEVEMGAQRMGRSWKIKFGDYAVEESKMGPTKGSSRGNLLGTKSQSNTTNKFSFVLSDNRKDLATVDAVMNEAVRERHSLQMSSRVHLGTDELLSRTKTLSASITTSSNKEDTWVLLVETTHGRDVDREDKGSLTNGERTISIAPTTSDRDGGDSRHLPALGYEFMESERSLAAMQYHGGGLWGLNKQFVWLDSSLEPRMKLVLAAAMTTLLRMKLGEIAGPNGSIE